MQTIFDVMNYSRLMAIDYGEVRIGIAMSDLMKVIASPFQTYTRKSIDADLNHIAGLIKDYSVDTLVVGLPLNMQGEEGKIAKQARDFVSKLKLSNCKIEFLDERLTSIEANDILIENKVKLEKRKDILDKLAATIILKNYMEQNKYKGSKNGK